MMNEHDKHCKAIADDLKAYADGSVISYNGEIYDINNLETIEDDETGNEFFIIDGEKVDPNDTEILSLFDYFEDCYDVNYVLNSYKELIAVRVMVACGGPNIYINTWDKRVELFWWTEHGEYYLDSALCEDINSCFEELYNC